MTGSFRVGEWQVEPQLNLLQREGRSVHLQPKVIDVLCTLAEHPGEVLKKENLIEAVWPDTFVSDDVLAHAVWKLREAFDDDPADPRYIRTVPRRGYQLIADVDFPEEATTESTRYRLLRKLGQGGMGDVHLAEDTELGRHVALKFLPEDKQAEPTWHRRLRWEARAAAALDHPFICKVYDTGILDGRPFIAMEYLEGEKLSDRLKRGPLPLRQALSVALEVAEALETAHRRGLVHRDLKPSNILLTEQGHAKITDFGIARKFRREEGDGKDWTLTQASGEIAGTPDYMSPEQIRGEPVDPRSDLFQFGIVLYAMVTGRRPFEGDSRLVTLSAVLNQEPKPVRAFDPELPAELETLVSRCLKKDPNRRIQHMDDVRLALVDLKEELDRGLSVGRPRWIAGSLAAAGVLIAAAVGWFYLLRPDDTARAAELRPVPLTSYPGWEMYPSFSPDGTQVAFQGCPDGWAPGQNCDIYVKQIGLEAHFPLTDTPEQELCPAWSPDGQFIAFLRQLSTGKVALVLIPQRGGRGRTLAELDLVVAPWLGLNGPSLAWTPDSKYIVAPVGEIKGQRWSLYAFSLESGEKQRLTTAPSGVEQSVGDRAPALSPDGRILAFTRMPRVWTTDIWLLRLGEDYKPEGEPEKVRSENPYNTGVAWTSDGRELVFSSSAVALYNTLTDLWRVRAFAAATPRKLPLAEDNAATPAISRQGNRLAYAVVRTDTNIWRVDLEGPERTPGMPFKFIASTRREGNVKFSPDGKRIAFTSARSGTMEIWLCDSDGSNPVSLHCAGGEMKWSPDGQSLAFFRYGDDAGIYVISANGGAPRRLTTEGDHLFWSLDGRSIYFRSRRSGIQQIWNIPVEGGEATQISYDESDVDLPQGSPDGRFFYYGKGYPAPSSVWKLPVEGSEATRLFQGVHPEGLWTVGPDGIYFFTAPDEKGRSDLAVYEFATAKARRLLTIERPVTFMIEVSPDGRTILYPQVDEAGSDLILVENFR